MKRKAKRFDGEEGSQVFSEAQEKWLGGADRTDPYILARMRNAVPDEPKKAAPEPKAEPKAEPKEETKPTVIESSEETGNKGTATETAKPAAKPVAKSKAEPFESNFPRQEDKAKSAGPSGKAKAQQEQSKDAMERAQNKAGPDKIKEAKQAGEEKRTKEREHFESTGLYKLGKALFSKKSPNRSYKSGGSVRSSASSRGDGIATKGHTRGKIY